MPTERATSVKVRPGLDAGLLILRGAGLFLLLTFGWQKLWGYIQLAITGGPWDSLELAPLIRSMGFPAPVLLGIYAMLCESVGALLISCGFLTRWMAILAALSMAGAFYTSLRLQEDPLRAALYLCSFTTVAVAGPGRFSLDYYLQLRAVKKSSADANPDAGLLALRLCLGTIFVLLFALKQSEAGTIFPFHPGRVWPIVILALGAALVTAGLRTRLIAAGMALGWAWALGTGLYLGQPYYIFPVRSFLFATVFASLALTGAGRFSVDGILKSRR